MALRRALLLALMLLPASLAAQAAGLKEIGKIDIPGEPITAFGTIYVDQKAGRAYLADKDNKAMDVIDTRSDRYVGRIAGLVGIRQSGDVTGPNGFLTTGRQGWIGDGDSTVKVVDLKSGKILDSISTGGTKRIGELSYDPKRQVVLAANPNDKPGFVTLISAKPGHKIIARIGLPDATDSIERSIYNPATGRFYVNIPELGGVKNRGGLAVIDAGAGKLLRIIPLEGCNPHGIAQSGARLYLGCGSRDDQPVGSMGVVDVKQGKLVANVAGLGGSGEWALNSRTGQIYAASGNKGSNMLNIIDYKALKLVDQVKAHAGAHSIAASSANNHVYFPTVSKGGPCGGCILVYAPAP
jgi:DNA-binding beta-propeller fold protein YncE